MTYTITKFDCKMEEERGKCMATQSILKNITITESTAAELFIDAMEKAAETAETSHTHWIESEDLSKDELKKFTGRIQ